MQNSINTRRKVTAFSLASISCLAVVALNGGTAAAEAQSRPAVTIAPFVLKSTVLEDGGTNAYRPWFENRKWTGDLIEYEIFSSGQRCTSVSVGEFPPNDSGNAASCIDADGLPIQNWSARGAYPDLVRDALTGTTSDDPLMDTYWKTRNLFFYEPGNTNNTEELRWSALSGIQMQTLDPDTCQGLTAEGECSSGLLADESSIILNYIRGDRSLETDRGGILRRRFSLLGAIINSRPVYVPVGNGLVMVGSNGGVVHGFNAQDGSETFGYVPSQFMAHLAALTDPAYDYNFRFFADGELRHAETSTGEHIVAGGLGSGGKGLFIMDVSDPANPKVLLELSGTAGDHIPQVYVYDGLGFIHGRPSIAELPDGNWYVVAGNGFESGAGAQLLIIPLNANDSNDIDAITASTSATNGLAAPALVDVDNDGRVDYAYAGDLEGNLWRFGLAADSGPPTTVFTATTDLGVPQSITVEPDLARHPTQIGVMVYFGTGRLLSFLDADDITQQTIYGIWDPDFEAVNISRDSLYPQTLVEKEGNWTGEPRLVRIIENESPNGPSWAVNNGWRVNLPQASPILGERLGERLVSRPQVRADRLQFITNNPTYEIPTPDNASPGYESANWINQLSLASGGSLKSPNSLAFDKPLYDLDRSGELDQGDAYVETVDGEELQYFPLGLNLGPGIISQPAFARVTTDVDAVFINGVIMLPPPESDPNVIQGGGDLDVTTDSPEGPLVNPHLDPEASPEGHPNFNPEYPDFASSPWANIPATVEARGPMNEHLSADGFGGNVDGHHRAYNRVHGVSYVDFFEIEPRAQQGLLRLDPGTVDSDGNPFTAIRELNQPSKDVDGSALVTGDQKFIVVLTNADLSQGTELKIGCRTWATFDYQNMITKQLLVEERAPANLVDDYHDNESLVFTLNEIDPETAEQCADGSEPTLRISVTQQVGDEYRPSSPPRPGEFAGQDVLVATLPGCVNNSHGLDGRAKEPGTNPHITPVDNYPSGSGSTGYRWRNGALTMQLLQVTNESSAESPGFDLQKVGRPQGKRGALGVIGAGGVYAKGFELVDVIDDKGKVVGQEVQPYTGENGLLYEASLFWNYGDMKEFQQEGQDMVCFGDNQWASFRGTEWDGLNSSQYNALVENLRGEDNLLKQQYIDALALLQSETTVEEGLIELARLFDTEVGDWARGRDPEYSSLLLGYYDRMRSYANRDNLKLLDIDQDLFELPPPPDVREDLTPATVDDVEVDLLPAAGPNFAPGRRSWIDLTPN